MLAASSAKAPAPPPRAPGIPGFRRDAALSYGDGATENALVHGENLAALTRLRATFASRFRCIYLDPPFNTGRTFAEYKDAATPDTWRAEIEARLDAMKPLLAEDGAIFVEIDDTELAPLIFAMDATFGRANRVSIVTIVRSASTGHKAQNRGPVNVTDYLLVYAKDKTRLRLNPQVRERRGYDVAYSTFILNRDAPFPEWKLVPLATHVTALASARGEGKRPSRDEIERFALSHAEGVVRFAQPRYEAVSHEARRMIDASKARPTETLRLEREAHKDMFFRGGNRILFLADKVRQDGARSFLVEPLTNVWDDVPFQGIAREGGVVFTRNKKPERLVARIVAMATDPNDWVLDAYLGSGTTAAVAHKMGRRWVGIEQGAHVAELCLPRLRRVIDGEDATGITREQSWTGGGGFGVYA